MIHPKRLVLCIFVLVGITGRGYSQLCVGGGFGSFHVPGASTPFRAWGPTLRIEHLPEDGRTVPYLDISYFSHTYSEGSTEIYDMFGAPLGEAQVNTKFSYIYSQLGFKHLLGADPDEKRIIPYIGAGIAVTYVKQLATYQSTINVPDDVSATFIFGAHYSAGIQYNARYAVFELRGNLDIVLKPLVDDVSNIATNLRLSVTIPITKY
jgi:hypothetical protein